MILYKNSNTQIFLRKISENTKSEKKKWKKIKKIKKRKTKIFKNWLKINENKSEN
jgi:hypothetical protein